MNLKKVILENGAIKESREYGIYKDVRYYDENYILNREGDKPSLILYREKEVIRVAFYKHNELHRIGKPAIIYYTDEHVVKHEYFFEYGKMIK